MFCSHDVYLYLFSISSFFDVIIQFRYLDGLDKDLFKHGLSQICIQTDWLIHSGVKMISVVVWLMSAVISLWNTERFACHLVRIVVGKLMRVSYMYVWRDRCECIGMFIIFLLLPNDLFVYFSGPK